MYSNTMYWVCMAAATVFCFLYNALTSKKYGIPLWKFMVITLLVSGFNWGATYLAAWVAAGFAAPEEINGVRTWLFAPLFLISCALVFRIQPRRLLDAMTPSYVLAFGLGKLSCVFGNCCYGIPYEGPFHIYNFRVEHNVFPIQLLESAAALLLFVGFLIYLLRNDFKITGRQYPTMLLFYAARFIFEFFRDNTKIWYGLSELSFHALADGVAGILWLYFTTPAGRRTAVRIGNRFRRLLGTEPVPVLTEAEYEKELKKRIQNYVTKAKQPTKKELLPFLIGAVAVSFCCVLILVTCSMAPMMSGLVAFFTVMSLAFLVWCAVMLKRAG